MTKAFPLKNSTDKSVYNNNNINNKRFLLKCKLNIPSGNKRKGSAQALVLMEGQENGRGRRYVKSMLLGKNLLLCLCWQQSLGFNHRTVHVYLGRQVRRAALSLLAAQAAHASPKHDMLVSFGRKTKWIAVLSWAHFCLSIESIPFTPTHGLRAYRLYEASLIFYLAKSLAAHCSGLINTECSLFIFLAGIVLIGYSEKLWVCFDSYRISDQL